MQPRDQERFARILSCAAAALTGCQLQSTHAPAPQSTVTFHGAGTAVLFGREFSEHLPADVIIAPRAIEPVVLPLRPETPANGRPVVVVLHAHVDRTGRVREVTAAPESFPPPTPEERELHAAAVAAVARWQFEPAEMRRLAFQRTNEGDTYWIVKWRNASPCRVALTFTFPPEGPPTWALAPLGDAGAGE